MACGSSLSFENITITITRVAQLAGGLRENGELARKWRGNKRTNEKLERKWRENEKMERERENGERLRK